MWKKRAVFSITLWCFSPSLLLWALVFYSVPVYPGFFYSLCTNYKCQCSQEAAVCGLSIKMTVNSSFLCCSCGSAKAGFTQCDTWHRYVLSDSAAPAKLKKTSQIVITVFRTFEALKMSCIAITIILTCYPYTFWCANFSEKPYVSNVKNKHPKAYMLNVSMF